MKMLRTLIRLLLMICVHTPKSNKIPFCCAVTHHDCVYYRRLLLLFHLHPVLQSASALIPTSILEVDILSWMLRGLFPSQSAAQENECLGSYANGLLTSIIQEAGNAIVSTSRPCPSLRPPSDHSSQRAALKVSPQIVLPKPDMWFFMWEITLHTKK